MMTVGLFGAVLVYSNSVLSLLGSGLVCLFLVDCRPSYFTPRRVYVYVSAFVLSRFVFSTNNEIVGW